MLAWMMQSPHLHSPHPTPLSPGGTKKQLCQKSRQTQLPKQHLNLQNQLRTLLYKSNKNFTKVTWVRGISLAL